MSVQDMIQEAKNLTIDERKMLIKALVDMLGETESVSSYRSLRDFKGLGAHLYDGTDAQAHVDQLRDEWD